MRLKKFIEEAVGRVKKWISGSGSQFVLYGVCVVCYLLMGAAVLVELEGDREAAGVTELKEAEQDMLQKYDCLESLEEIEEAVEEVGGKVTDSYLTRSYFPRYFFSAVSILTTTGYGDSLPLSQTGTVIFLFYAVLGIPLFFNLIDDIVYKLQESTSDLHYHLYEKLVNYRHLITSTCFKFLLLIIIVVLEFIMPSIVFTMCESEWGYVDSLYYSVISGMGIGLGNFIPGEYIFQEHWNTYMILVGCFQLFSVILTVMLFSVIYDICSGPYETIS